MFFATSVNTLFVAISKVHLNCKRYLGLAICNNQFEPDWATKQAAAAVVAEENLIRNAGHGLRKPFVQARQETSVSFSCQRHSLSSSIPCSNSFTGKHSNSTVLHCPTHHLIPTCCWLLIRRGPGDTPNPSGPQFTLAVFTLASPDVPREGWRADRLTHPVSENKCAH